MAVDDLYGRSIDDRLQTAKNASWLREMPNRQSYLSSFSSMGATMMVATQGADVPIVVLLNERDFPFKKDINLH